MYNACLIITFSRTAINQLRLPILLCSQLNKENTFSLSQVAPKNLVSPVITFNCCHQLTLTATNSPIVNSIATVNNAPTNSCDNSTLPPVLL